MPVIEIDDDAWRELQRRAVPLVDTPSTVLRRMLGMNGNKQAVSQGNVVEIQLSNLDTYCREWALIPVHKDKRRFFPGYKEQFVLETDIGNLTARVSSAPKGTPMGDPDAGSYVTGGLRQWYEKHPHLKDGDKVRIEALEPGKRYKLSVASEGV
jgi:hypothetical protein